MTAAIATTLLELTTRILHKGPSVTTIAIDHIDFEDGIAGGKSLAGQGKVLPSGVTRRRRRGHEQ